MRIGEIMKRRVETIAPEATLVDAVERMRQLRVRHLVVSGGDGIGVISERDIPHDERQREGLLVRDAMTKPVVVVQAETTVREAANLMRGITIGCLPVLDAKGKLSGIVTTSDLLTLLGKGTERPTPKAPRWILKGRGPRRKQAKATGERKR